MERERERDGTHTERKGNLGAIHIEGQAEKRIERKRTRDRKRMGARDNERGRELERERDR